MQVFERLLNDESGATAIEYGLIAALISIAAIALMSQLGDQLKSTFQEVKDGLEKGTTDGGL